jgi:hypothetical protein
VGVIAKPLEKTVIKFRAAMKHSDKEFHWSKAFVTALFRGLHSCFGLAFNSPRRM